MEEKVLIQFFDTLSQKYSAQFQVPINIRKKQLLELSGSTSTLFLNGNVITHDLSSVLPNNLNKEETLLIKTADDKEYKPAMFCSSSFSGHESAVLAIACDKNNVYTVGGDCTIRKWDIHSKLQTKIAKTHSHWVQIIRIFNEHIFTGSMDHNICVLDKDLNVLTIISGHNDGITGIEILGNYIVSSSRDRSVKFWIKDDTCESLKYKCVYSYAHNDMIIGLYTTREKLFSYSRDGYIKIYKGIEFDSTHRVHSQINVVKVSGNDIFVGCEDGSVFKNRSLLVKMNNVVSSLDVSENGIFVAVGSFSKKVAIYTTEGAFVTDYMHFNSVYKVQIRGQSVYSSSKDKTIRIFSLNKKKVISELICKDEIYDFLVTDNLIIAACKDSKVYFFQ